MLRTGFGLALQILPYFNKLRKALIKESPLLRLFYHGFTLIEMLVVMVIIGIILSFATLGISHGETPLKQEAQRLASLVKLARFEALLQTQAMGLFFDSESYHFYQFQEQHWQSLEDDDVFRPRFLQGPLQLTLNIDNMPVPLEKCKINPCLPQLLLLSDGESTPFEIILTADHLSYHLMGTATGEITLQRYEK